MKEKLKNLLLETQIKPESYLVNQILERIELRGKRIARIKLGALSTLGISSLVIFIPVIQNLSASLSYSGFYEYISIAFSNLEILSTYWQEIGLSLLESLPIYGTVISLGLIFVFFLSFKEASKQIQIARFAF
ncbi:MAG: hypothetical protein WCX79_04005 [Candidatus Paceibacterota bacterium]|jgi:hypothetical protein